jgi:hypothetical protein
VDEQDLWTERIATQDKPLESARNCATKGSSKEDLMKIYIILLVIVAIPAALIIWRRRGHDGEVGHDAEANKDIAGGGPPNQSRNFGPGGPL